MDITGPTMAAQRLGWQATASAGLRAAASEELRIETDEEEREMNDGTRSADGRRFDKAGTEKRH
ncbi:hypothetical protein [Bradyrhizobium lablabi]|uniref:hypothetical protein n=1 Tax=Bradyrhizobium lablabi TaxID=722472 RepID=UPI001FD89B59|nr:hypothetical protein [Bradyrhizobium lablabi]